MTHFRNRTQFLHWLSAHAPNQIVKRALDMGTVTVWGLFKSGFIVEVEYRTKTYVIGIRASEKNPGEYFTGLLSRVPFRSYSGGSTPLTAGDYPVLAWESKKKILSSRPVLKKR